MQIADGGVNTMWSTNLIRPFLDELSEAVAVCNRKGVVLYHNKAFESVESLISTRSKNKVRSEWLKLIRSVDSAEQTTLLRSQPIHLTDRHRLTVYLMENPQGSGRDYLLLIKTLEDPNQSASTTQHHAEIGNFTVDGKISLEKLSPEFNKLIGEEISFKLALLAAQRAAHTDFPVLLIGESGTGKEILAQTIHKTSQRSKYPFVDINCAAIPDTLIESELFGYDKGAFTGASREGRHGLFDEANGGSIFLDEIGDASLQTQSKLLRVLQEGVFKRVGGSRNIHVNVRHIAATNKDLTNLIKEGKFREDLFYRLNTFTVKIPPLRERLGDIDLLVKHFLEEHQETRKQKLRLSRDSLSLMQSYDWPGNVRELKGVIDFAATMSTGPFITPDCLPSFLQTQSSAPHRVAPEREAMPAEDESNPYDLPTAVQKIEKELIKKALLSSVNKTEAIKTLGISRRTFYLKLQQYGLT